MLFLIIFLIYLFFYFFCSPLQKWTSFSQEKLGKFVFFADDFNQNQTHICLFSHTNTIKLLRKLSTHIYTQPVKMYLFFF